MNALFQTHILNESGIAKSRRLAELFNGLLISTEELVSSGMNSREFSLAKTHLEQACFFAKKALAQNPHNQADPAP